MNMHEHMPPGIYEDEWTGDIWRKSKNGDWTVNGRVWKPFPKALTTLHKIISSPKVSIVDASTMDEWRVIPTFPNYEVNSKGKVRSRDDHQECSLSDHNKPAYWLYDTDGYGHWLSMVDAYNLAFKEDPWTPTNKNGE